MHTLDTTKKELKKSLLSGIDILFARLEQMLSPEGAKYNQLILLMSRYRSVNQQSITGILATEEIELLLNQLRSSVLKFVDNLDKNDLSEDIAHEDQYKKKAKQGRILHRIPTLMQYGREEKCIIRIALDEEFLLTDVPIENGTDRIEVVRVSEVMGASIIDPNENSPFFIRTITEPIQFIDESDYTEWVFYVKPRKTGVFPLILKVTIIELINGKERKREVVLEKQIEIRTEFSLHTYSQRLEESEAAIYHFWLLASPLGHATTSLSEPAGSTGGGSFGSLTKSLLWKVGLVLLTVLGTVIMVQQIDSRTPEEQSNGYSSNKKFRENPSSKPNESVVIDSPGDPTKSRKALVSSGRKLSSGYRVKTLSPNHNLYDYVLSVSSRTYPQPAVGSTNQALTEEPVRNRYLDSSLQVNFTLSGVSSISFNEEDFIAFSKNSGPVYINAQAEMTPLQNTQEEFTINDFIKGYVSPNSRRVLAIKTIGPYYYLSERFKITEQQDTSVYRDTVFYVDDLLKFWDREGSELKYLRVRDTVLIRQQRISSRAYKYDTSAYVWPREHELFTEKDIDSIFHEGTERNLIDSLIASSNRKSFRYYQGGEAIILADEDKVSINSRTATKETGLFNRAPRLFTQFVICDENGNSIDIFPANEQVKIHSYLPDEKNKTVLITCNVESPRRQQIWAFDIPSRRKTLIFELDLSKYQDLNYRLLGNSNQILITYRQQKRKRSKDWVIVKNFRGEQLGTVYSGAEIERITISPKDYFVFAEPKRKQPWRPVKMWFTDKAYTESLFGVKKSLKTAFSGLDTTVVIERPNKKPLLFNRAGRHSVIEDEGIIRKVELEDSTNKVIVYTSYDGGKTTFYDYRAQEISYFKQPAGIRSVLLSPDGKYLLTNPYPSDRANISGRRTIAYKNDGTINPGEIGDFSNYSDSISFAFTADSRFVYGHSPDGDYLIYDLLTARSLRQFREVFNMEYAPGTGKFLVKESTGNWQLYDPETSQKVLLTINDQGRVEITVLVDGLFIVKETAEETTVFDQDGVKLFTVPGNRFTFDSNTEMQLLFLKNSDHVLIFDFAGNLLVEQRDLRDYHVLPNSFRLVLLNKDGNVEVIQIPLLGLSTKGVLNR